MDNRPSRKILKSPVAKRRSRLVPKDQKITLERVLGLTSTSNTSLACDPNTGNIAYLAGCVVIIYSPKKNKQNHIFNFSKKTLTALAYSGDGKHLVTGESGHQPAVRIWDAAERVQVAEFHGHKFGISCVAFSPNLKYIVSIGTQHDMQINVWNWKSGSKVASNKVSSKVTAVSFSADGSYFVTAGMRHVKFWYLDSSKSKINETVPLSGRNGLLGDHKNNFFCDVATGTGSQDNKTFCITQSGLLCQFNEKRQMDKWVELRTTCASSISAADNLIFVGCAKGVVRVFDADSLYFVVTLPRPHYLGVDIAAAVNPSHINPIIDADNKYPDTLALAFDEAHRKVTCIYNDHSVYVWDVHDLKKIGKSWSFLYHSSCVYGVEVYPVLDPNQPSILPNHSFITCSSDDTIRIWNLDPHMAQTDTYKSNIYSHDLLKIMYMDPSLASLCDVDYNPSGSADKTDTNYDDKNGIRSIRVSPDGQHLASGDRQGNVRIIDFKHLKEVKQIEAHESEVLCLEYSTWKNGPKVLASSSRDRLIHVYDTEQQYGLLQTLSDHSSSISSVKFTETDGQLKMLTCGADKSILFRNLQQEPDFQFVLGDHLVEKMTLYDMDVEPTHKFAAIACQDRNVRIYNVKTGKKKKEYKGSLGDDGILLRMKLDPSGSYAATSCSDKNICIIDFYTGELLATMYGHSEIATDVRFMNDLKHIISTSGDGCIFIWRLPKEMTTHMQNRLQEMGKTPFLIANGTIKQEPPIQPRDVLDSVPLPVGGEYFSPQKVLNEINPDYQMSSNAAVVPDRNSPDFRFSISQLPSWAKKQVEGASSSQTVEDSGANPLARGRWAQRAEGQPLTVKQQDGKSIEVNFATDRRRFTAEAESLSSQLGDVRRETMVLNRMSTAPKNMPIIHDDTMVEEDGDDDDEDFLKPISSSTFVKQDSDKPPLNWDELYSFDAEDIEQPENTEIIYYPPSESDGSDTLASSYQVFDAGPIPDRAIGLKQSYSMTSIPDADSETTDPVSLEDVEEDNDSNASAPSTPMEEFTPKTQHREKFLKDAFENLSFTPTLPTDKFVKGLDTLEEEMNNNYSPNSRQSLSARFMSKSIAQRNAHGLQRQENWFDNSQNDSVQRRKDDMARNLDESRKMLMAMGWKQDSPETDKEDAFADSPPLLSKSRGLDSSSDKLETGDKSIGDKTATSFTFDPNHTVVENSNPPPSPRTPKSLRRCWSTLDLPKTPIPEERGPKTSTPTTLKPGVRRSGKDKSTVPIQRVSKNTSDSTLSKIPSPKHYSPKHCRRTLKTRVSTSNSDRRSSKEPSQVNKEITGQKDANKQSSEASRTGKGVPRKREPTSNSSNKREPTTGNNATSKRETNNDGNSATGKSEPNTQTSSASTKREKVHNTRSVARSPVGTINRSHSVESKGPRNISNLPTGKKSTDRDLMPPPSMPVLAKQKQESRFLRRANQQNRRKTTSALDLTLEQATDILKGNSGILKKNQKAKRSSSSSPTPDRNKDSFVPISDSNFLTVASEIEITAAQLRLQNGSGVQGEAMPNDLPERDIPPVHDIPKSKPARPSSLSGHLTTKKPAENKTDRNQNELVKPSVAVNSSQASAETDAQTVDDDLSGSPSVKERIARLHGNSDGARQTSPHGDRGRAKTPDPTSPRITSSVRLSLGGNSNSNCQQIPSSVSSSMTSSVDSAISCSNSEPNTSSLPRGSRTSFQPIPFDPNGEVTSSSKVVKGLAAPASQGSSTSGLRLSPPAGLTTSLDSEGLSRQLSPTSSHSNTSPQSVADTGVGSDTDFDLSVSQSSCSTYKGDQKSCDDPIGSLQETMDQISRLSDRAVRCYQLIQDNQDERSMNAKKMFHEQCCTVTKCLSDCSGLTGTTGDPTMIPVPRDKYNTLTELLLKVNSVAADIRHCSSP